ncbi:Cyclopropane-fatty-acyl-phospholipid synthase (CFA synthase) (Cyclopropane fatty acid synthase) [Durusdinium trenchii]|uniref:Cyclopropane-fatty-acyl-phospholipid synthase (CFA synthase) (Cyclopropane fatty acid synthase) n=1 Tax=Durusdinium trenchii TaxID=1381693 RepID=A0ABP0QM98_9DINO
MRRSPRLLTFGPLGLIALCLVAPCFVGLAPPRVGGAHVGVALGCNARTPVVRQAFSAAAPAIPLVGAVLVFFGFQALNTEASDGALKELLQKYTKIQIINVTPDTDLSDVASGVTHRPVLRGKTAKDVHWYARSEKELPPVKWYIRDESVLRRVLFEGGLGLGESYMDGHWDSDDVERLVYELLRIEDQTKELGARELPLIANIILGALRGKLLELPGNTVQGAQENIGRTYDVDTIKIYEQMLDSNMQYSVGYFYQPDMTLDDAQLAKMELIGKKLALKPGMKLLEIGFGFGSLAHFLATKYDVHITAVTLSKAQMEWAKEHYGHPNIDFQYADYRDAPEGQYDRVYSVGMFEHVGRKSFATYFDKVYNCLKDDGIFLLHTLGWAKRGEWNHNAFVGKYIFPGGELPTLYLLTEEFSDQWHLEDFQSLGKCYVQTLRSWLNNLKTWEGMDEFDTRFKRMWEYYLSCCAAAFEKRRTKVWQMVWTKQLSTRLEDCNHIRLVDGKPR